MNLLFGIVKLVNFSNKLKIIKLQAFLKCNNLKQVTIPDSVINMNSAFRDCENLQQISLSNNLSEINSYAFYKCQSLTEITIPQNIKKIYGDLVFNLKYFFNMILPKEDICSIIK